MMVYFFSFRVRDFPSVDNDALTVSVTFFLNMFWVEPRIVVLPSEEDENLGGGLALEPEILPLLWKPGTVPRP